MADTVVLELVLVVDDLSNQMKTDDRGRGWARSSTTTNNSSTTCSSRKSSLHDTISDVPGTDSWVVARYNTDDTTNE